MGSVLAEFLKLSRRPAVLVLTTLAIISVAVLIYGLLYVSVRTSASDGQQSAQQLAEARQRLYPASFLWTVLSNFGDLYYALALILGGLAFGSEYGWATWKTVLTQGPGRTQVFVAKLAVVTMTVMAWVVAMFAVAAASSSAAALLDGAQMRWPQAGEILSAMGSALLILLMWVSLGAVLAVVFRQAALALGLGLTYATLELVLAGTLSHGQGGGALVHSLPGFNAVALAHAFAPGRGASQIGPGQAALVIAVYCSVFAVTAALLVRNRDVT